MPVIGFLGASSPETSAERMRGFHLGLKEAGYVEGDNVTVLYRWGENHMERLPELAVDLIRRGVAVIACFGNATALATKAATTTVPVVFGVSEDPVRVGLVASLARPGGNLTGVNYFSAELVAKRLELLRALVPGAAKVAVRASGACRLFDTQSRPLTEQMVDRRPTGTPSHDGERHSRPRDMDRPAVRHGKLDDAGHEQET
jgi:ABC transporter substrate binding protein